MSFAENLKQIRKNRGLSQEELAEIMEVSRQAISKWELGESYPEVEKLLILSKRLNISLDVLLSTDVTMSPASAAESVAKAIALVSPNENVIVSCTKVLSSQKMKGGARSPQYALFGVDNTGSVFWGEPTTFLGWYANRELLAKEIREIQQAIAQGLSSYELKYSAKVERNWLRYAIVEEAQEH